MRVNLAMAWRNVSPRASSAAAAASSLAYDVVASAAT
jgi:hypothetical protein